MLVGAAGLSAAEQNRLEHDQPIRYGVGDLLEYAPVTERNVAAGR